MCSAITGFPSACRSSCRYSACLEERGVFSPEPLDLVLGLAERDLACRAAGQHFAGPECGRGLLEFALKPLFEAEQVVEPLVGEEAAQEHFGVPGADAIDAAVPLDQARMGHEVPGMRGICGHVTPAMRAALTAMLQDPGKPRWPRGPGCPRAPSCR
jgi:hypothetical protein